MENKKELGIYIHIPFCKQKCYYCDFISYSNKCDIAQKYINCLLDEIEKFDFENYDVNTIYIGGGTPSYIDSKYIKMIMSKIKSKVDFEQNKIEITIEVNPGTVTKEKLNDYKEAGVNRLSIGLQSVKDDLLKQIGRIHTDEDFLNTYQLANEVGFNNINVDLMIGLPNQSIKDIKETLEKIIELNPNHISVYSLIVEEGTKFDNMINKGELNLPDEDTERNMYWYVKNTLESNSYNHYEISNFAKENKESKHNMNCWEQKEYIGFGVSAHSYINCVRFSNTGNINEYIKNIEENNIEKNKTIEEKQTKQDEMNEFMMLGFRKIEGVNISEFKQKFIDNPIFLYREKLEELVNEELIEIDLDYIRLTNKGLDLANYVFEEFV